MKKIIDKLELVFFCVLFGILIFVEELRKNVSLPKKIVSVGLLLLVLLFVVGVLVLAGMLLFKLLSPLWFWMVTPI